MAENTITVKLDASDFIAAIDRIQGVVGGHELRVLRIKLNWVKDNVRALAKHAESNADLPAYLQGLAPQYILRTCKAILDYIDDVEDGSAAPSTD